MNDDTLKFLNYKEPKKFSATDFFEKTSLYELLKKESNALQAPTPLPQMTVPKPQTGTPNATKSTSVAPKIPSMQSAQVAAPKAGK